MSEEQRAPALVASEETLDSGVFYRHWRYPGARAVALLVHGLGEHSGRYQHVAEALAARGIATLAPDHPGHGRSPGTRCHIGSFEEFFTPLDALLEVAERDYGQRPRFIIGHSMGGLIAGQYLLRRQSRFHGAVFSGAAFEAPEPPGGVQKFLYRLISKLLPKLGAMQVEASEVSRDPEVVAAYRADPLVHDGKVSVRLLVSLLGAMEELQARRGELTLPMLVMHGEGDVMTASSGSRSFVDGVGSTDKTLRVYDGLYHEIFNEPEQAQVLGELVDWLDGHIGESDPVA